MKVIKFFICVLSGLMLIVSPQWAGDDASGPVKYEIDFAAKFSAYTMTESDYSWSRSLRKNFKFKGKTLHFVQTSLLLKQDGKEKKGFIYRCLENKDFFYSVSGDAFFDLKRGHLYSPGVGGFSVHWNKKRKFIVCLNFSGGVPFSKRSKMGYHKVWWMGSDFSRFKLN